MASPSTQHSVDIDELSASTKEKLQILPPLSSEHCIYRAPLGMRSLNKKHFTPQNVSIGPIHYRNEKLRKNKHLKERYLAEFCQHTRISLKDCYKLILDNERKLRKCYADDVELNSEDFVEMVLVDAAFLIMMLVYQSCKALISCTDRLFKKPKMISDIVYDVVLLENQLPFFILEDLYKLSKLHSIIETTDEIIIERTDEIFNERTDESIIKRTNESKLQLKFNEETAMIVLAYELLKEYMPQKVLERIPSSKPEHILDLYKSCLIPANWNPKRDQAEKTHIPGTEKLYQAGVEIQRAMHENMFHIKFKDGILEIPPLFIYDSTELLFRNLLAYELCHCPDTHIFSDYFEMMRLLTLSSKDVELLVQNQIIFSGLPNAERVSKLFQGIGTGNIINWSKFLYNDVITDLNKYYELAWHKWKKTLREKYFKAPWAICSVSAAVLLFALAIIQTVFTILQFFLPK